MTQFVGRRSHRRALECVRRCRRRAVPHRLRLHQPHLRPPFLGCSSANYITWEITKNVASGTALGLPFNATELVTGEHSGLANTRPGNPGELDPPDFDSLVAAATTGATLPAGTYFYAVTVSNAHGQTPSPAPVSVTVAAGQLRHRDRVHGLQGHHVLALPRQRRATGPWTLAAQCIAVRRHADRQRRSRQPAPEPRHARRHRRDRRGPAPNTAPHRRPPTSQSWIPTR